MKPAAISTYVKVWVALIVLLALTLASSYVPLKGFNTTLNLAVACAKAALVALFFMRLRVSDATVRLAAAIGVVWFLILVSLSLTDFLARN
jgi:cytochrome c oxidase subunit 4